MPNPEPRPIRPADVGELHEMVRELADFEKIGHLVKSSPGDLADAIFGQRLLEALVIDRPGGDGLAAFALFYRNFSSFTGKPGLWLEDLYVRPDFRGTGFGKSLFTAFIDTARQRGCGRAEWSVLDWNQPAVDFYRAHGGELMPDWRICRITFKD
ncbi:GNAT family N-acetyltransferase [Haloferula sargassicola]